jgi:hypothetical protein
VERAKEGQKEKQARAGGWNKEMAGEIVTSLGCYLGREVAIKQFNEYSMSFRLEDFYREVALLR